MLNKATRIKQQEYKWEVYHNILPTVRNNSKLQTSYQPYFCKICLK